MTIHEGPLGRIEAPDDGHLRLYGLTAEAMPAQPESVVVGCDWTRSFDAPVEKRGPDGKPEFWVGLGELGAVRGGHCVCIPFDPREDVRDGWRFFDQGAEGTCVGFGWARRQAIHNRRLYDGFSLYDWAVEHDGIAATRGRETGTTVRAGGDALVDVGAWRSKRDGSAHGPYLADGIERFLWARSIEQMLEVLANAAYRERGAVPFLNSWGKDYPRVTWAPLEAWEELLFRRQGDCALAVDRPGRSGR